MHSFDSCTETRRPATSTRRAACFASQRMSEEVPHQATPMASSGVLQRKCLSGEREFGHNFGQLPISGDSHASTASPSRARHQETSDTTAAQDSDHDFQREHFCLQAPDPSGSRRKPFSSREAQRASFGLWNAQSIASQAFTNLAHHDPYHLRLAEQAFHQPVDFNTLNQNVGRIRDALNGLQLNVNVWVGTCDEPDCNDGTHNFVAVTLDDLSGVVLCPFYFMQPARTLATTFIHEAGHMANIDVNWAPGKERYCRGDDTIECDNICPISGEDLLLNVDAWMWFIYCLAMSG
jgi:hypothetical protein